MHFVGDSTDGFEPDHLLTHVASRHFLCALTDTAYRLHTLLEDAAPVRVEDNASMACAKCDARLHRPRIPLRLACTGRLRHLDQSKDEPDVFRVRIGGKPGVCEFTNCLRMEGPRAGYVFIEAPTFRRTLSKLSKTPSSVTWKPAVDIPSFSISSSSTNSRASARDVRFMTTSVPFTHPNDIMYKDETGNAMSYRSREE